MEAETIEAAATVRANLHFVREALAALIRQAGGRLIFPAREWGALPDGELTFEFPGRDMEAVYRQRRARESDLQPEPGGKLVDVRMTGAEMNALAMQQALALTVAASGGRIRFTPDDLIDNWRIGAIHIRPQPDGGMGFYTIEGGTH